jgi:hypothetical protein
VEQRQGHDIVTGETCVPDSLNTNLEDAAVLLFPVCGWGCAYLGLQVKAMKPHLALLVSSSHRLFIISPHLLCLIYKLNSIIVMWVQEKNSIHRVLHYLQLLHPLGVLEHIPLDKGGIGDCLTSILTKYSLKPPLW